jgi:hypothetical protein
MSERSFRGRYLLEGSFKVHYTERMKNKNTKNDLLQALRQKLASDGRWAQRALLAIFKNQTADEQDGAQVKYHNNMGFRVMDAEILTSFAESLAHYGRLTEKQMRIVHKLMPIYARQLIRFCDEERLFWSLSSGLLVHWKYIILIV